MYTLTQSTSKELTNIGQFDSEELGLLAIANHTRATEKHYFLTLWHDITGPRSIRHEIVYQTRMIV